MQPAGRPGDDAPDGRLGRRGHDRGVAEAARRLGRGRRGPLRSHHRQGGRRDPLARHGPPRADPGRARRDRGGRHPAGRDRRLGARPGRGPPRGGGRAARDARRARPNPDAGDPDRSSFYSPVVRRIAAEHGRRPGCDRGNRDRGPGAQARPGRPPRERRRGGRRRGAGREAAAHRVPVPARAGRARVAPAGAAPRGDVADAAPDRGAHAGEPAHLGALHDDRRSRPGGGRRRQSRAEAGDGGARRSAHLPRLRRPGHGRRPAAPSGPERLDRGHGPRLPRRRQPRNRGGAGGGPDRAGDTTARSG